MSDALGVVRDRAVVLEDDFDLLARDGRAMLRLIELHGSIDLLAGRGLLAGHRHNQADLDGILRDGRPGEECDGGGAQKKLSAEHGVSSRFRCVS